MTDDRLDRYELLLEAKKEQVEKDAAKLGYVSVGGGNWKKKKDAIENKRKPGTFKG